MTTSFSEKDDKLPSRDVRFDSLPDAVNEKGPVDQEDTEAGAITKDGLKLHPQPTGDLLDPLNWSLCRKHIILAIVMLKYFLFTYITTTTVPSFPQLQADLGISSSQVNWTVAIPALGLAFGPLFWSSFSDIYGRRIVFIVGTVISLVATIAAAVSKDFSGYMAARFFQGFGVSPGATVGMAVINDLFFEYERGQKLGLWVLSIDTGLLVGPIIGGFIDLVSSAWIQWSTAILFGLLLVLEIVFMSETLYPRTTMLARMPAIAEGPGTIDVEKFERRRSTAADGNLKRTTKLPFLNIRPIPGMRLPKPWDSVARFFLTFRFSVVATGVLVFCFAWYWWILSIITMLPTAYAQYSPQVQGLFSIGLLLGTIFSEIFCAGRLSDWLCVKLAKKNNNVKVAEMRLWLAYPGALLSAVGLIIWGVSIDKGSHWIVGQIAFFLFAMGVQMGNTVISAYIIDCYPLQSMSVITFYAVFLNLSAFINPFFIAPWQAASGWTLTFAVQGTITFFASVPVIAALHVWGPRLRKRDGQPGWVNPEFDAL